jgi:hypothetical protein
MTNYRSTLPRIVSFTSLFSGDVRAQENPQLAVVHTVMMREHNRIARALKQLNSLWSEEVLFQETRSIVIAELHHITYTEYLPAMLGKHAAHYFKSLYRCTQSRFFLYKYEHFRLANRRTGHARLQLKSIRN